MPIPFLRPRQPATRRYGHITNQTKNILPNPKPRHSRHIINKKRLKQIMLFFLFVIALSFIGGTAVVAWITNDLPDPNKLIDRQVAQSTKIYDRTGKHLLYEIYQNQKRTLVELNQISDYAKNATIAIEDKYFYTHKGIRIPSIIRAAINNLLGRQSGSGGASTLTQQLIKNAVVGDEHSVFRKLKEAIMAIRLEKKYNKDEILKLYLNEIPYGSTNYGIEAASQSYFHKNAKDLTAAEAATIAAIAKAPSQYLSDLNSLRGRRDIVINLMFDQGYITETQKKEAQNTPLRLYRNAGVLEAPHFVLYVKQMLADSFGEQTIDEGGLKVITTLDYEKQQIAEKTIKEIGDINEKQYNANNAALIAIDPKTGQILSMVGSRDYENDIINGKFNVAVLGKRQPGSSFKPIVYTAAFEKGFTPDTVLYDVKTNFDQRAGENYTPQNYSGKEYGLITMRQALQGSLNITAVKTLYLVGVKEAVEFAQRFGYTTFTGDYGLSLVLGGGEVNLLEHTAAFATLANEGTYHKPVSILSVTDNKGKEIYKLKEDSGKEVIKKELAATISNVLSDNNARSYIFGTNNRLILSDRPVATKTGTTNDYKDAWTMGYTPSLTVGVWVGNTTPSTMKGGGEMLAAPIWNKFLKEALKNTVIEKFPTPPTPTAKNPLLRGKSGGIELEINKKTGKIASSSTPKELVEKKTYLPPHTILQYVDKNNPDGPAPQNPSSDPQYEEWEKALKDWFSRTKNLNPSISMQDPPTEYDTPQSAELAPDLEIIWPTPSSTINTRQLNFKIKATAPRGISEINYYIDNSLIANSNQYPFDISYYAKTLATGEHTLKITADDDIGNTTAKEIKFDLQAPLDPPDINWFNSSPLTLNKDDFPRSMMIEPFRWEDIKEIKIYLKSNSTEKLIYTFDQNEKLFNKKLMFTWNNYPGSGDFTLQALMTDKNNNIQERKLTVKTN